MSAGAQLYYRIPSGSKIGNPSKRLYPVAVRVDGSVWIVAQAGVPEAAQLVEELRSQGAVAGLVYYREDQIDHVRALALDALRAECDDIAERAEAKATSARERLADAERLMDASAVTDAVKWTRARFRGARKAASACESAAVLFGLTAEVADLLTALRAGLDAEAQAILGERAAGRLPRAAKPAIALPGSPCCEAAAAASTAPVSTLPEQPSDSPNHATPAGLADGDHESGDLECPRCGAIYSCPPGCGYTVGRCPDCEAPTQPRELAHAATDPLEF